MTRTQITLAVLGAAYLLALRGCYEIVPVSATSDSAYGAAYRLNRLTGSVVLCADAGCVPLGPPKEPKP